MKPVDFVGSNMMIGPPKGSPDGACGNLHVRHKADPTFVTRYDSMWKPTADELAQLNAGGHVCVMVAGMAHPPIWVAVALGIIERPPAVVPGPHEPPKIPNHTPVG